MLGLALRLQAGPRPDLKLAIMSATLDSAALEAVLPDAVTVRTAGRTFPVDVRHLAPNTRMTDRPVWEQAAQALPALLASAPEGDTLVFMPGLYEINRTLDALRPIASRSGHLLLPLHGSLPPEAQDRAAAPATPGTPRIIVATNIAETSLTIDGVTRVLDSGLVRRAGYDPRRGIGTLLIEKISRASADQRAGRAGRTAPGSCMRLWSERDHATRLPADPPELLRTDLAETLLHLKQAGVSDPAAFPWITPPPPAALADATSLLIAIGALTDDGAVTPAGERMTAFPLHPRIARLLLAAEAVGGLPTLCLVAALLQERQILLPAPSAAVRAQRAALTDAAEGSDFMLLIRKQQGQTEVRLALLAPIEEAWLSDCGAVPLRDVREVVWDPVSARLVAEQRTMFRDLVIRARRGGAVSDDEAATALAEAVLAGRVTIKDWDLKVESWIARVNLVAAHCPEAGVPAIDESARRALLEQICHGLRSAKAVKQAPVQPVLRAWLDPAQTAAVDALAPLQTRLENGRSTRIHYDDPSGPYIALRVQDLYDTHHLPPLCNGRVALKVRILAPNMRPVQITDDLHAFWTGSYAQVKRDLRGRYPKHEWR